MTTIHTLSRQVLQCLAKSGSMLKSELIAAGIADTDVLPLSRVLQALSKRKQVMSVRMSANVYEYSITSRGRVALDESEEVKIEVRPVTPSRTICNGMMPNGYATGMGRARVGLAMIGV